MNVRERDDYVPSEVLSGLLFAENPSPEVHEVSSDTLNYIALILSQFNVTSLKDDASVGLAVVS